MPTHTDPLMFYESVQYKLSHITQLATKCLSIQVSSAASERAFSTSGDILSAERCCIDE